MGYNVIDTTRGRLLISRPEDIAEAVGDVLGTEAGRLLCDMIDTQAAELADARAEADRLDKCAETLADYMAATINDLIAEFGAVRNLLDAPRLDRKKLSKSLDLFGRQLQLALDNM